LQPASSLSLSHKYVFLHAWLQHTPLFAAVSWSESLPLTIWLVDEMGADVNGRCSKHQYTPLYWACSLNVLDALLERGADPTALDCAGFTPLMYNAQIGSVDLVARLLQDQRVRATIDIQNEYGDNSLHHACWKVNETAATSIVHLLLQAGANPALTTRLGGTPLFILRQKLPDYWCRWLGMHKNTVSRFFSAVLRIEPRG